MEEQVRRFGFEGDVADFVDDDQWVAGQLGLQIPGVVPGGEPVDTLGGGGELDAVAGLAGPDRQADGEMGLTRWVLRCPGGPREYHVVLGDDEVQGAQVGDLVPFQLAGVVEVELFQRLAAREPGGLDPPLDGMG